MLGRFEQPVIGMMSFVAILLFAYMAAFGYLQVPIPTPFESSQTEQQQSQDEQEKTRESDGITSVAIAQAGNQGNNSNQESSTNWWIMMFTGVLALVALLQWLISFRQANLMDAALVENRKAANAATKTADTARDSLVIANRAYLTIDRLNIAGLTPDAEKAIVWFSFFNMGKVPAKIDDVLVAFCCNQSDLPETVDYLSGEPFSGRRPTTVYAGKPSTTSVQATFPKNPPFAARAILEEITHFHFYGWIDYEDDFGEYRYGFGLTLDAKLGRFRQSNIEGYNYDYKRGKPEDGTQQRNV